MSVGRKSSTTIQKALQDLRGDTRVTKVPVLGTLQDAIKIDDLAVLFNMGRRSVLDRCDKNEILVYRLKSFDYALVDEIAAKWMSRPERDSAPRSERSFVKLLEMSPRERDQIERILEMMVSLGDGT